MGTFPGRVKPGGHSATTYEGTHMLIFIPEAELRHDAAASPPDSTENRALDMLQDLRKRDFQVYPAVLNGQLVLANPISRSTIGELIEHTKTYYPYRFE
jgi:hypothetical protein